MQIRMPYRPMACLTMMSLTFALGGCVINTPPYQKSASEAEQYRKSFDQTEYMSTVDQMVADQVRRLRVEQERTYFYFYRHPVILSTGWCHAIVSLSAGGQVMSSETKDCASPILERIEQKAIHNAAPFPPPGHPIRLAINTHAPDALPGIEDR